MLIERSIYVRRYKLVLFRHGMDIGKGCFPSFIVTFYGIRSIRPIRLWQSVFDFGKRWDTIGIRLFRDNDILFHNFIVNMCLCGCLLPFCTEYICKNYKQKKSVDSDGDFHYLRFICLYILLQISFLSLFCILYFFLIISLISCVPSLASNVTSFPSWFSERSAPATPSIVISENLSESEPTTFTMLSFTAIAGANSHS